MIKKVQVDDKEYTLKSSAYTQFAYKNMTGRDLLKDIGLINKKKIEISKLSKDKQSSAWLSEFTTVLEMIYKMAYVMITEYDNKYSKTYEEWLKELDTVSEDFINDVIEVGFSPFRR